jgi:2,2-dialkylglycine decarboxylase (pyruvate)
MAKRIRETVDTLMHLTNTMLDVPRLRLHEKLARLSPSLLEKSVFLVCGSDLIEDSIELPRKATDGLNIIGLHAGLHGFTSYVARSVSFNWDRKKHTLVAPHTGAVLTPYCYCCPLNLKFLKCELQCLSASMELADANFTAQPFGFIAEPLLSAGGIIVPLEGYFTKVKEEC